MLSSSAQPGPCMHACMPCMGSHERQGCWHVHEIYNVATFHAHRIALLQCELLCLSISAIAHVNKNYYRSNCRPKSGTLYTASRSVVASRGTSQVRKTHGAGGSGRRQRCAKSRCHASVMKFGRYIDEQARPDWTDKYLDYGGLKKHIKDAVVQLESGSDEAAFSPRTTSLSVAKKATESPESAFYSKLEEEVCWSNQCSCL